MSLEDTMAVHRIIKMGNPILRQVAEDLSIEEVHSEETKTLIADMFETMQEAQGIGLAAPQIGVSKKIAIIEVPSENDRYPGSEQSDQFIIINPKIEYLTEEQQGFWEGCLSVPGLRGFVERPSKIRVNYLDHEAKAKSIELEGFLATVFQHELDHLFGKIYVDRITDMTKLSYEDEFIEEA